MAMTKMPWQDNGEMNALIGNNRERPNVTREMILDHMQDGCGPTLVISLSSAANKMYGLMVYVRC
jgi:hypothetical protein